MLVRGREGSDVRRGSGTLLCTTLLCSILCPYRVGPASWPRTTVDSANVMADKVTAPTLQAMKARGEKIVCVTAYDAIFGALADEAGADVVLVGDSVGNTVMGQRNMLQVTLDNIAHHTAAVARGVKRALLVADLPFGTYQESPEQAVRSSVHLVRAGAEAVKLEGAYVEAIEAIRKAGIPVIGHVGMTPQSVHSYGGFKVQGKGDEAESVLSAALAVDAAGTSAIVLELIPADLAQRITEAIHSPTIGIGAGPKCSGEVQVLFDILGFSAKQYRHTKRFLDGKNVVLEALAQYVREVRAGAFPTEENSS